MGIIHGGIPKDLALRLQGACNLRVFIETGTYKGDTAAWAAEHFARVFTIEIDPDLHAAAEQRFARARHVCCRLGDSRAVLAEILPALGHAPALIWLDAHNCGCEDRDSPLLAEIELVNRFLPQAAILIDDARFILAPLAGRRLCTLDGLTRALDCPGTGRDFVVLEDVAVAVPAAARAALEEHCKEVTVANWESDQALGKWRTSLPGRIMARLDNIAGRPSGSRGRGAGGGA
jgi:hypothetical protein